MGGFCAGLAFSPDDELFVCNASLGIVRVKLSGEFAVFASHAGQHKMICPNYGLFDSAGNYYVTDSGNWKKNNGYLLRFTPDGQGKILGGPYGYANGLALTADEMTLFMVESNTDRVFRFEIKTDGTISSPEVYVEQAGRFPDGLTLDAEGNLYVSCYASDDIHRVSPSREKTLFAHDRNAILLGSPTNMAFGGENLDVLYVANLARTTITRARVNRRGQPLANQKKGTHGKA
jgi:gluconolactonase